MAFEEAIILGVLGISAFLFYAWKNIEVGDDNPSTGEFFDPMLQGLRVFFFIFAFINLLTLPPIMWHMVDLNSAGCVGAACDPYTSTQTIINLETRLTQLLVVIVLIVIMLTVVLRAAKFMKDQLANSRARGRDRRRRKGGSPFN